MRDVLLQPFRAMVKFQLDLGFPIEVVQRHLNGEDGAPVGDGEGERIKYDYRKRKFVAKKKKTNPVRNNAAAEFTLNNAPGLQRYCGSDGFWYIGKVEPPNPNRKAGEW
jgi:hypothetical protein